jgi:hypothetical protein
VREGPHLLDRAIRSADLLREVLANGDIATLPSRDG